MKPTHTPSFWMDYCSAIKESVQRELTQKDYSVMMASYIARISVEDCVNQLEGLK